MLHNVMGIEQQIWVRIRTVYEEFLISVWIILPKIWNMIDLFATIIIYIKLHILINNTGLGQ